jgi:hypothetical protein
VEHAQDIDQQAAAGEIAMAVIFFRFTQGGLECESRRRRYGAR